MLDTLRFWLDRGVDGFRIDVAHFMMKDPEFRSNPPSSGTRDGTKSMSEYDTQDHLYDKGHSDIFALHQKIRSVIDEYDDRFSVGEIHESDWTEWAKYFGERGSGLHMPFNFSLLWSQWDANDFRSKILSKESVFPAGSWPGSAVASEATACTIQAATRIATQSDPWVRPAGENRCLVASVFMTARLLRIAADDRPELPFGRVQLGR